MCGCLYRAYCYRYADMYPTCVCACDRVKHHEFFFISIVPCDCMLGGALHETKNARTFVNNVKSTPNLTECLSYTHLDFTYSPIEHYFDLIKSDFKSVILSVAMSSLWAQ